MVGNFVQTEITGHAPQISTIAHHVTRETTGDNKRKERNLDFSKDFLIPVCSFT